MSKIKIKSEHGDEVFRGVFLGEEAGKAIEIIEKEIHRRRRSADNKVVESLTLLETGLWSHHSEACWDMETRIIEKQKSAFRLIAPDEPLARATLIAESPQKATGRGRLVGNHGGSATLF